MAPTAETKTVRKGVQVHATLPAEKFDALEDWRWTAKLNMVDLVKVALDEFAKNHNIPNYGTDSKEAAPAAKAS